MDTLTTNDSSHNVGHRFQPGNPGGPGRPKKATELAMLDTIKADWPPERISEALNTAMQFAVDTRSWRGVLSTVELVLAYGVGKPTQKVETNNGQDLLALLATIDFDKPLLPPVDPA
jgi:hypothetical protein